jgi:hypothetical protein
MTLTEEFPGCNSSLTSPFSHHSHTDFLSITLLPLDLSLVVLLFKTLLLDISMIISLNFFRSLQMIVSVWSIPWSPYQKFLLFPYTLSFFPVYFVCHRNCLVCSTYSPYLLSMTNYSTMFKRTMSLLFGSLLYPYLL